MIQSQLYGRACDLCKKIHSATVQSIDSPTEIVEFFSTREILFQLLATSLMILLFLYLETWLK